MASFVLSFFPLDVLDEIWDLIESVPEGFLPTLDISCPRQSGLRVPLPLWSLDYGKFLHFKMNHLS